MSSPKLRPTSKFLLTHLQEPEFLLGSRVTCFCGDPSHHIKTLMCIFSDEVCEQKWYQKGLLIVLVEFRSSTSKCLIKDTLLWHGVMSTNLKKPEVQDDPKKGILSNQPQLMHVTPTALLGSCEWKPIKDMTFLVTDFETHAYRQGSIEEPAAKDHVVRKARTIALSKAQGSHWNGIKCVEHLGNRPEAVIRQVTINLNSQVWRSLGDSMPKLYCVDWAEAYVTQKSVCLRIYHVRRNGMIRDCPTDACMRNLRWKAERGKKTGTDSSTRYQWASCFEKTRDECQKYGGARTT